VINLVISVLSVWFTTIKMQGIYHNTISQPKSKPTYQKIKLNK